AALTVAAAEAPIPLWPGGVPGPKFAPGPEHDTTTAKDNVVAGKPVIRLGNVTEPSLTFYPAPKQNNTGAAVLVFPGGGYSILALDLEGTEICSWLNSIGINAVLLKYRVPQPPGSSRHAAPLQDAQRAMGVVRQHAAEWNLDSKRIGVLGFSAGGHLAALLSNDYAQRSYPPVDPADQLSCRPDFAVLIYPAYLAYSGHRAEAEEGKTLAPEFQVTAQTPATFIVQTEDDPVHVENSLVYYRALKDAKVTAEMHLFSTGGHGYGMRPTVQAVTLWPKLAEAWLRQFLKN
ncbi:MAG TPA: alpha/beta hydrolase, partial [Bryobacteraceae bacterium]|nr:alpha/beta hydrolase [Bryobacteraceae bacterium]